MSALAWGVGSAVAGTVSNRNQPTGTERGQAQRDYMDAAYGDLNQWEQAGAGQAGDAAQAASDKNQTKLQWAQLRSQESAALLQAETQKEVAAINAGTSRYGSDQSLIGAKYGADTSAGIASDNRDQQQPLIDANVANAIKDLDLKESTHANLKAQLELLRKGNTTAGKSAIDFENMLQDDPSLESAIGAILGSIPMGAQIAKIMKIKLPKKLPKTNSSSKKANRGARVVNTLNKRSKQAKKNTPTPSTRKQRRDSYKDPSQMTESEQWDTFTYK